MLILQTSRCVPGHAERNKAISTPDQASRSLGPQQIAAVAIFALVVIAGIFIVASGLYRELSFTNLIRHRAAIDSFVTAHGWAALAGFVAIYATSVALSIPGATVLTVSAGFLFGALAGGLAAFVGAMTGATAIFLIARTALGEWLARKAGPLMEKLADGFRRDAFWYLLFLRLVPLFPFWLVNIAPAFFGVRLASFIGATAIGIAPLTFAFAFFGAGLDSAIRAHATDLDACLMAGTELCEVEFDPSQALTPNLIAALAVLGVVSLIPVAIKRWRAAR